VLTSLRQSCAHTIEPGTSLANRDAARAIPYPEAMSDTVTLDLDAPTAAYLRICAQRDGGTLTTAAAHQLRQLALREAVESLGRWYAAHPCYAEDSEAETLRAEEAETLRATAEA
jgi:hypothetical protein